MKILLCATVFASLALLVSCGQGMPGGSSPKWILVEDGQDGYPDDKTENVVISLQQITKVTRNRDRDYDIRKYPIRLYLGVGYVNITAEKAIEILGKEMVEKLLAE